MRHPAAPTPVEVVGGYGRPLQAVCVGGAELGPVETRPGSGGPVQRLRVPRLDGLVIQKQMINALSTARRIGPRTLPAWWRGPPGNRPVLRPARRCVSLAQWPRANHRFRGFIISLRRKVNGVITRAPLPESSTSPRIPPYATSCCTAGCGPRGCPRVSACRRCSCLVVQQFETGDSCASVIFARFLATPDGNDNSIGCDPAARRRDYPAPSRLEDAGLARGSDLPWPKNTVMTAVATKYPHASHGPHPSAARAPS